MEDEEYLVHYGVARRSGRYPWGSGKQPSRSLDMIRKSDELKAKGLSEKERAAELGMSINKLRSELAFANEERKQWMYDTINSRFEDGKTKTEISRDLDIPESTVRKYINMENPRDKVKNSQLTGIESMLKQQVSEKDYLDVGPGSELQLSVSRNKLNNVVKKMEEEGYYVHNIYVPQIAGQAGNYTTVKVLTKDPDYANVRANKDKIKTPQMWSDDGGAGWQGLKPIQSVSSDRVKIVYGDKGGKDKDGLMELRRGAPDLDLGNSKYAQVRIGVDGTHYLKGMAIAVDGLPKGKDIVFYTNKPSGTPMKKVLKEMKDNPDNPFGATIKPKGQRGALNIVNEEGDWRGWKSTFSSQFLSKQPFNLIKERVKATIDKKMDQFNEIRSVNNPTLKKKMLNDYADELDGAARSLKLQGFPKTGSHVILPFPTMKPNEVYAPKYENGSRVVLVRHPHGGKFELPELIVNNKGLPKSVLGNAVDAIGIHPSVAEKMSGADFDGDSVLVIPNNQGKIKTLKTLEGLKDFDPNSYKVDRKTITPTQKQTQMGVVSNLITDMTLKGASASELARAVRHSMVVIDAEKHNLDWSQSARDNGVAALQRKYQAHTAKVDVDKYSGRKEKVNGKNQYVADLVTGKYHRDGASTLISKADKKIDLYDPETKRKNGHSVKLMDLVDDAYKLSSGTAVENEYARYANTMKKMAIQARNEAKKVKENPVNKAAKLKYKDEVDSLNRKLNIALSNSPRERQAQIQANTIYSQKIKENDYDKDQKKKLKSQVLAGARVKTGASKEYINITPKEWEAIQNNAVSKTTLTTILNNANQDKVLELAIPKAKNIISSASRGRALALLGNGYSQAEVADALGVSVSTISQLVKGE